LKPSFYAEVAKLADALDLGSSVERRASSSLALGTRDLKYEGGRIKDKILAAYQKGIPSVIAPIIDGIYI
jgi:hypothetical protein